MHHSRSWQIHGTPARCTLQFVRRCYRLRGIYGRFDSRFDSNAKKNNSQVPILAMGSLIASSLFIVAKVIRKCQMLSSVNVFCLFWLSSRWWRHVRRSERRVACRPVMTSRQCSNTTVWYDLCCYVPQIGYRFLSSEFVVTLTSPRNSGVTVA